MVVQKKNKIYIVAYHYVRPIKKSKYKNLKGLEFDKFREQINFFKKKFNILDFEDFYEIVNLGKKIPKKPSILLTFDDGYKDHFDFVFPYLIQKNIKAIFYPPTKVIDNKIVLDVNKIHFVLAKEQNRDRLLKEIKFIYKNKYNTDINYESKIKKISSKNHKFDDSKTTLIKSLLQYLLPKKHRGKVLTILFSKVIDIEEKDFAKKIYMNKKNIIEMNSNEMSFGIHGENHYWWEYLDKKSQKKEVKNSIGYFKKLNFETDNISVCYPHGSYNQTTLNILKDFNVSFALTTKTGFIDNKIIKSKYRLPRYDTNDFLNRRDIQ